MSAKDLRPAAERLLSRIEIDAAGCWLWQGPVNSGGYGLIRVNQRVCSVHRVAHELFTGPIPEGLVIDHLCRVRRCCNPDHLEAVTFKENVLRGEGMGARHARQTHCKRGHEFTEENTYVFRTRGGWGRQCLACRAVRVKPKRLRTPLV